MKEFAFAEQAAQYFNEFKLNLMQSELVQRVLVEKIDKNNERIRCFNENEEEYAHHARLIDELHAEAVSLENIVAYMLFIKNGEKDWQEKSTKDMRIACAIERARK